MGDLEDRAALGLDGDDEATPDQGIQGLLKGRLPVGEIAEASTGAGPVGGDEA